MTTARMTYADLRDAMDVTGLPEARSGDVEVRRFTVSKHDADLDRVRSMFSASPFTRGRSTPEGTYTALYRKGRIWMSDTPDERRDALPFVRRCDEAEVSTVLVNGLGLGSIIGGLVHVLSVQRIDIAEIDPDVIALVADHVRRRGEELGVEVRVLRGDAFTPDETWGKGTRWGAAWHDIWPTICSDDYEEHKRIRRMYGRRVGFQDVWAADAVRRSHQDEKRTTGGMWLR